MSSKSVINEINITPLTDIFLVLLIIMMVVAPMLEYPGISLSVPSIGPDEKTTEEPKTMTVWVDKEGTYYWNTVDVANRVDVLSLARKLRESKDEFKDGLVIQVNPEASHEAMTRVMDLGQQAGINKMAVSASAPADEWQP